eukprot:CAMPEP_0115583432 /NCGR_PEP_ID=MMETSP0272-20121206/6171_1 /TAXON_ID=71861 /ORGANISM="Scrippsiella trochoidea, Strain CCMP3099" /LENGTH=59 /DNA_ID=CAMNT_0003018447 /DNA_START=343 /DNA_END=522 /DNA_ORIENTATION=+
MADTTTTIRTKINTVKKASVPSPELPLDGAEVVQDPDIPSAAVAIGSSPLATSCQGSPP